MLRLARGSFSAGYCGALRFEGYIWASNPRLADYESGLGFLGVGLSICAGQALM
jgi:hypothetical protein